jgi:hypothetical protein
MYVQIFIIAHSIILCSIDQYLNILLKRRFFKNTERLLKMAEEGDIDEVTSCLNHGVAIESKNEVRLTDLFDCTYTHTHNGYLFIWIHDIYM